jgi:peptidoglycan/xylan/chitin deacetylase (PgdA/CDA1 family)
MRGEMRQAGREDELERGVFTLSLDLELIWGTLDLFGPDRFRRACEIEREVVIDRVLGLLTEFEISATWLVVGHLFLDRCARTNGLKHPEIDRPQHAWCKGDWFSHDPDGSEVESPVFLGRSLVEKIRACSVPQEIGSHSFSHVIFGDPGCSEATARSEIRACVGAARELGIEMRSFSFPRSEIGHVPILREYGFTCFRGLEPTWYSGPGSNPVLRRFGHLVDTLLATEPPVVVPRRHMDGLVELPGSMVFFPAHGLRRLIPVSWRTRRALKGLRAAVQRHRIFHLWTHPTNLADAMEPMLDGLQAILEQAARLRERGLLRVMPMNEVAALALAAEPVRGSR